MTSTRTRALLLLALTAIAFTAAACRSTPDVVLWGPCTPGSDPTGTDGQYSMVCENGVWTPVMTVDEFVRINGGEPDVFIAPLPTRPAPATTTTSTPPVTITPPTTTAAPVTTTTTVPVPAPTITAVSPNAGFVLGGTTVTITGTSFTGATSVTFGGLLASHFVVHSSTSITATAPAHAPGAVDVSVTTSNGSATSTNAYTYLNEPVVTSTSPSAGPDAGGTSVTITGTNFGAATSVNFGGTAAASFTIVSPTTIVATTPAHVAGSVNVWVDNAGGTGMLVDGFTYVAAPTVTLVTPDVGPVAGGTNVTIMGTDFDPSSTVSFGGAAATSVMVNTSTSLSAVVPAGSAGTVDVSVTSTGGTGTATDAYRYVSAPSVAAVSPSVGASDGGTSVTLTGTNLADATAVTFGGLAATIDTNTPTALYVAAPAHAAGSVDVVVTTAGGSATLISGFTYVVAPTVSMVAPDVGPSSGDATVTLYGSDLADVAVVTFDGNAATVVANTSTELTVTTPAGTAGAVDVAVTTAGGTVVLNSAYTYVDAPTITLVSPNMGATEGGTPVTITGTNFTGATSVTFGGTPAPNLIVVSSTTITVTTPAHPTAEADVVVSTPGGTATRVEGYFFADG